MATLTGQQMKSDLHRNVATLHRFFFIFQGKTIMVWQVPEERSSLTKDVNFLEYYKVTFLSVHIHLAKTSKSKKLRSGNFVYPQLSHICSCQRTYAVYITCPLADPPTPPPLLSGLISSFTCSFRGKFVK